MRTTCTLALCLAILAGCEDIPSIAPEIEPAECQPTAVGVVGCSLSLGAISGYESLGGTNIWSPDTISSYPGGDLGGWSDPGHERYQARWSEFATATTSQPPRCVWWLIPPQTPGEYWDTNCFAYADALAICERIRGFCPDTPIYVSCAPPRAEKEEDYNGCGDMLARGLQCALVADGLCDWGPTLTQLSLDQTIGDGYHPNRAGKLVWGRDLLDFFSTH